jgi:hypothetical protein
MKSAYSRAFASISTTVAIVSVLAPFSAFAQSSPTEKGFCVSLSKTAPVLERNLISKETHAAEIANKKAEIEAQRETRAEKIDQNRTEIDEKRAAGFAELEAKSKTEEAKEAVRTLAHTVNEAAAVRRTAIDTAFTIYDTAVKEALNARATTANSLLETFTSLVRKALADAQDACSNGIHQKEVRETYTETIQKARTELLAGRTKLEKTRDTLRTLSETRKEAVATAEAVYKKTVQDATATWKTSVSEE